MKKNNVMDKYPILLTLYELLPFGASLTTLFISAFCAGAFAKNWFISLQFMLIVVLQIPIIVYLYSTSCFNLKEYTED